MTWTFVPIALLLTLTPGAATAMVIRSAIRGGWRCGVRTVAGNEVGVIAWALLSVLGISALVAASAVAFVALKVVGAGVLVYLGAQSLLHARRRPGSPAVQVAAPAIMRPRAFRDGVITSLANPKLAVFFVALLPQFVHRRGAVLASTVAMAGLIIVFDFAWYTALAVAVGRARSSIAETRLARCAERVSGTVLIALGVRVAIEHR
jgi:threonine/homoserine/homoserine lactone efflux protein